MPEEKIYVIPLRDARRVSQYKRAGSTAKIVRKFIAQHMKSEDIKLDNSLNSKLWERGMKSPPHKIRVKAVKEDDGSVVASLAE
jgi:large subunit ribosomal protein L31e